MLTHRELANALRILSVDAIQKANSGHPGMPMGMADVAEVLWNSFLKHNPRNPQWSNRDRFILSNGHGSMLHYSLLHLTGYDVSLDDIKNFRQLHSKTPGHPEVFTTPGVETTTGPLGQGLANAVGMALAEKLLASKFNREGIDLINHYTYVFVGDGCLMEGISHEVCSLAGTWQLGKLIVLWDDNRISIDGNTKDWFSDDTVKRFEAYRFHVIRNVDGHDANAIYRAIEEARAVQDKPSFIDCRTTIGFGAPTKANTASCHGSPLGEKEIQLTRENLHWSYPPFEIPSDIYQAFDARKKGAQWEMEWNERFTQYQVNYPELAQEWLRRTHRRLPKDWKEFSQTILKSFSERSDKMATRKASQEVLHAVAPHLPELLGGSADLTESNLTEWKGAQAITADHIEGNYIHYGIREFGMSAIMNGIVLYGAFIPYGGTFLVFYTYAANAVRMAALMKQRVIFVYSHDSMGVGEDGPTHQPVEQLTAMRATPNLSVWRPCGLLETAVAWFSGLERKEGPTALILSRQAIPPVPSVSERVVRRGGYVLFDCKGTPDGIIIAAGSEVPLAVTAAKQLQGMGKQVRVVSMPSMDVFDRQERGYREEVLPSSVKIRVAVEAGSSMSWYRYVGELGRVIGIDRYGESAPADQIFEAVGLTVDRIVNSFVNV